jgi:hypothetical protein
MDNGRLIYYYRRRISGVVKTLRVAMIPGLIAGVVSKSLDRVRVYQPAFAIIDWRLLHRSSISNGTIDAEKQ